MMTIHVRRDGRSTDLTAEQLGIDVRASDTEIRRAVARDLDVALEAIEALVVDRRPSGDVVLRPEAVYG